jgi:Protein of unknown function (DUF2975)
MKALGKGSVASVAKLGLTVAWWALWLALGALALGAIGYAALLSFIANGAVDASILTDGATWPVVLPALLIGGVAIGGALIIVGRLRRLFDSFTSGEPFRRENADHLRAIWITMLAIEVARFILLGMVGAIFVATGTPDGVEANFKVNVDISTWMSILILIVLAEVFREGARMKEEQELTI